MVNSLLQSELVSDIQRLLLEGGGNITIAGVDGRKWQLNVTPIPVLGTTPIMDGYFFDDEA
jgi:hypothetical protein